VVATEGARSEDMSEELKSLAREVRGATETTDAMSREIEREINAASLRMKGVRERVAARLDQAPSLPEIEAAPLPEDLLRLHERVREMVQDATRKSERVSAASERASRSAERFMRRLEEELHEVEGLVVRLGPAAAAGARGARERPRSARAAGRCGCSGPRPATAATKGRPAPSPATAATKARPAPSPAIVRSNRDARTERYLEREIARSLVGRWRWRSHPAARPPSCAPRAMRRRCSSCRAWTG
jgi:hypothetical protein